MDCRGGAIDYRGGDMDCIGGVMDCRGCNYVLHWWGYELEGVALWIIGVGFCIIMVMDSGEWDYGFYGWGCETWGWGCGLYVSLKYIFFP